MAGIAGTQSEGADSILVNGGYEDDEDYGDTIICTGHGGNKGGRQVAHQELKAGNLAFAVSAKDGLPVRVVRGPKGDPTYSPVSGFRYDGLYSVDQIWEETGLSGFKIWRYKLVRIDDHLEREGMGVVAPEGTITPKRIAVTTQRLVRSTEATRWVKSIHEYCCQVCGDAIATPAGPYAEGAHIRPLGRPHNGPDTSDNILCLCPNDHVRLDRGSVFIDTDFIVRRSGDGSTIGTLRQHAEHSIADEHLAYHRIHIAAV